MSTTILTGHEDAESAYIIADYPYGFRLRCQMRVWVETNKQGQRVWRQTSNPKRPGLVWNKPKASTYSPIALLALDDEGHVTSLGVSGYSSSEELLAFEEAHMEHLTPWQRRTMAYLIAGRRASKRVTVTIHTHVTGSGCCDDEPLDVRMKAEKEMMAALVKDELRKESNAALAGVEFDRVSIPCNNCGTLSAKSFCCGQCATEWSALHEYKATHAAALPDA